MEKRRSSSSRSVGGTLSRLSARFGLPGSNAGSMKNESLAEAPTRDANSSHKIAAAEYQGLEGSEGVETYNWGKVFLEGPIHDSNGAEPEPACEKLMRRKVISVACSNQHVLIATDDGSVFGAGSNEDGSLSPSTTKKNDRFSDGPVLLEDPILTNKRIVQVACGIAHSCFLSSDGYVVSFGENAYGQLGHSRDREPYRVPGRIVQKLGRELVVQVACTDNSTFVLTSRGKVYSFGLGEEGVLGLGTTNENVSEPKLVGGALQGNPITFIATGSMHVIAASITGRVFGWGRNTSKQLGIANNADSCSTPRKIQLEVIVKKVAAGKDHTLFLSVSGKVYAAGRNSDGQLGVSSKTLVAPPTKVRKLQAVGKCVQIACTDKDSCALMDDGRVYTFGSMIKSNEPTPVKEIKNAHNIEGSVNSFFALNTPPAEASSDRRKSLSVRQATHPIQSISGPTLSDRARLMEKMASGASKRKSIRTFRRELNLPLFDFYTFNSSFLKSQIADNSGKDRIDEKRNSCVALEEMVEGFTDLHRALVKTMGKQKAGEYLRMSVAPLVAELDEAAPCATEPDQLRAYLILLLIPFTSTIRKEHELLVLSLKRLPKRSRDILFSWIKYTVPTEIFRKRLIKPLLRHTDQLLMYHRFDETLEFISKLLQQCFKINTSRRSASTKVGFEPVLDIEFYSLQLTSMRDEDLGRLFEKWRKQLAARKTIQENNRLYGGKASQQDAALANLANEFNVFDYSFLLSADAKRRVLQMEDQQSMFRNLLFSQLFNASSPYFVLEVRRDHILEDTIAKLSRIEQAELRKPLRVKFAGEDGLDAGGVKKEFFGLLSQELFSPNYGIFRLHNTGKLWFGHVFDVPPEPSSIISVGILIGLAVYNSTLLDVNFPVLFWRLLLQKMPQHPTLDTLAELDPQYAKNLLYMKRYEGDDLEDVFMQNFEVSQKTGFGETKNIPLKPNGADIAVTKENVDEYIDLVVRYFVVDSISAYSDPLVHGFNLVVPANLASLSLFEPSELELATIGLPNLDFDDLQTVCSYEGGYDADHPTIKNFWNVVKTFDQQQKEDFMKFSTGSPRAPVGGLRSITFKIQRAGPDNDRLVSASTCFNTLLLPDYATEEKLRAKLLQSISYNFGFGLE